MPRKNRRRMAGGKLEDQDRREREKQLRQLRRELRRLWRQRNQTVAELPDADDAQPDPDA